MSPVPVVDHAAALRLQVSEWRMSGQRIALVPTMGALHEGHVVSRKACQSRGRQGRGVDFRQPDAVCAQPKTCRNTRARSRRTCRSWQGSPIWSSRRRLKRCIRRAIARGCASPAPPPRTRGPLPSESLRGCRDGRREALQPGAARHRDLRRQGLPAAPRHRPHGARPSHAGAGDCRADAARAKRSRHVVAQSIPQRRRSRARGNPVPERSFPARTASARATTAMRLSRLGFRCCRRPISKSITLKRAMRRRSRPRRSTRPVLAPASRRQARHHAPYRQSGVSSAERARSPKYEPGPKPRR